jgi:hypothetical protein
MKSIGATGKQAELRPFFRQNCFESANITCYP